MKISIIIVNYKVKKEILRCIRSIIESKSKINFEIIVIDNDEKNTIEEDLKKQFSRVKYVKSPKNIGFGAGCNLGAKHAKGEYLFFLNPDTEVFKGTIDTLLRFISGKKDVGAVSPLILDKNGKISSVQGSEHLTVLRAIFSLSFIHKIFPNNPISRKFFLNDWDKKTVKEVDVVPGTAFMIGKNLFDKIGGFDEKFFLFFEEADLCNRINKIGFTNYILPDVRVIHIGGISTEKRDDIEKIFSKSRFYYFKKWHGIMPALLLEGLFRLKKKHLILGGILVIALALRIYRLDKTMEFIGDQGWFYLSARDMILTGRIPLVGITASHTWLHQGPYWTYILAVILKLFNFNPLAPAYFTAILGTISIFLIYKLTKEMFSSSVALFSALLYATSPLIIANDRFAYHTSPIPFFTLIFIFSVYKWIKGNYIFFAPALISLGVLYNFELATASLFGVLFIFLFYGIIRRKSWAVKIFEWKVLLVSICGFILSMAPVIIYDFKNGFPQTLVFGGWIFYKIFKSVAVFSSSSLDYGLITSFLASKYKLLIFAPYNSIAFLIFLPSFIYFLFKVFTQNKEKASYFILLFVFLFPLLSIYLNKTASDAYIPVLFPSVIAISSIFFASFVRNFKILGYIVVSVIVVFNIYFIFKSNFFANGLSFKDRENAAGKVITLTKDKRYNLIGKGEGSQFESFTMNYEYLLWRKGYSPSSKNEKFKIYISETSKGIIIKNK